MNNFRNAFSFFLNSMDYEEGKAWFDSFRRLKSDDDWIEFFTAKISQLEELDRQECYGILSELYKDKKDEKNMEICLAEERKIIVGLIKKDKRLAEKWIASNDFYCIKTVFENEVVKGTRSTKEWITIFDNCKSLLSKADLAECY